MTELLKELASMGISPDSVAMLLFLYRMDKRLTILETVWKQINTKAA
ncbi:hypothetical protein [Photobacterium chitinilyticum]|nr:hypothetical protein [Photobacterium chitinilyticum]